MVFEDIRLPDFVIADLYKNTLIEGEKSAKSPTISNANTTAKSADTESNDNAETLQIKFLGENKKKVVIVVCDEDAVYINDDKLQLLTNLLNACKLTIADVAIINVQNQNVVYKQIKQDFTPSYLLLMGNVIKKISLPFIFPEYKVQQYDNCDMLIAPDLQKLLGQTDDVKTEKRRLWESLKLIFKL
ncbi:MAG: hypothetical protein ACOVO1_09585 [Chitinophagaceae bacterium]